MAKLWAVVALVALVCLGFFALTCDMTTSNGASALAGTTAISIWVVAAILIYLVASVGNSHTKM